MNDKQPKIISISDIKKIHSCSCINDDLILFDDFSGIPVPSGPCRNTGVIVGLCLQGTLQYTADTIDNFVRQGQVMMFHDGQVIDNYRFDGSLRGIGLMMSYDFFQEIVKSIHEVSQLFLFSRSHPVFSLTSDEQRRVVAYFNMIKEKVDDTSNHFRKDVVRMLMSAMIYDISNAIYRIQQVTDRKQTRAEAIFTDFIRLVAQNFRHERRVSWYSEQLCITAKYLSESVKSVSHRSPNEWIDNYVTMELRVQLKNTMKSIKEIAHEMNFPNQSFMGKYFKEHVGLSPLAYRKS